MFLLRRAVRHWLKGVVKMKPLPKWVGWLSLLVGLVAPGGAFAGIIPPKWAAIVSGVAALVANLAHSLPGSGGTPNNP